MKDLLQSCCIIVYERNEYSKYYVEISACFRIKIEQYPFSVCRRFQINTWGETVKQIFDNWTTSSWRVYSDPVQSEATQLFVSFLTWPNRFKLPSFGPISDADSVTGYLCQDVRTPFPSARNIHPPQDLMAIAIPVYLLRHLKSGIEYIAKYRSAEACRNNLKFTR